MIPEPGEQQRDMQAYGYPPVGYGSHPYPANGYGAPYNYPQQMAMLPGQVDDGAAGEAGESLYAIVDDRLRGRWMWMVLVGLGLALVLAILGYLSAEPIYRSDGALRVRFALPVIVERTPETQLNDRFDRFVFTQEQLIYSRRVLENALEDPAVKALADRGRHLSVGELERGIVVDSDRNSELIFVSYEDREPRVAQVAVNAVLDSYDEIYGAAGGQEADQKLILLQERLNDKRRDLEGHRAEMDRIASRYPSSDLKDLELRNLNERQGYRDELRSIELELARRGTSAEEEEELTRGPTPIELENIWPNLRAVRMHRDEAQNEFNGVKISAHPESDRYARAERGLARAQQLYDDELIEATAYWKVHGFEMVTPGGNQFTTIFQQLPVEELIAYQSRLQKEFDEKEEYNKQLNRDLRTYNDLVIKEGRTQAQIAESEQRVDALRTDGGNSALQARIRITQHGALPDGVYKDSRKKRAMLGAMGGFAMSFGAFFLLGTIDRRAYGSSQLRGVAGKSVGSPPCLGVLPDLGAAMDNPEENDVASHCVHQIRNQIEAIRDPKPGYVLAVSSPYQGDGKTSIVMSLGWSYAAAGYRTLLVDCDLVGRSLTRQLGMLGQHGLREVLSTHMINGELTPLPVEHLTALPAGVDARFGPETIRRIDLEKLFGQLRDKFDIIIVDTGPLLGSLESTPVAAAVDGVVLTVRRGRSRSRLGECVEKLEGLGARCVGMILNCAARSDCGRYVSDASLALAEQLRSQGEAAARRSLMQPSGKERNALMLAMESSNVRSADDPSGDQ